MTQKTHPLYFFFFDVIQTPPNTPHFCSSFPFSGVMGWLFPTLPFCCQIPSSFHRKNSGLEDTSVLQCPLPPQAADTLQPTSCRLSQRLSGLNAVLYVVGFTLSPSSFFFLFEVFGYLGIWLRSDQKYQSFSRLLPLFRYVVPAAYVYRPQFAFLFRSC